MRKSGWDGRGAGRESVSGGVSDPRAAGRVGGLRERTEVSRSAGRLPHTNSLTPTLTRPADRTTRPTLGFPARRTTWLA